MSTYNAHIGGLQFELSSLDLNNLDIQGKAPHFHLLHEGHKYTVKLVSMKGKQIQMEINGNLHTITIEDPVDQLVDKLGLNAPKEVILKDIKAPMPGLILDIMVKPGQQLSVGDPILILEAMKMENVIKAEGQGVVKKILLPKNSKVEKNQVIVEME